MAGRWAGKPRRDGSWSLACANVGGMGRKSIVCRGYHPQESGLLIGGNSLQVGQPHHPIPGYGLGRPQKVQTGRDARKGEAP